MSLPKITWYIKENNSYVQDSDYYLGSFSPKSNISLDVQIWNNRYGQEAVDSLEDARLVMYFENIENSILLNYCDITIDNNYTVKPKIEIGKGLINIGKLTGKTNNGIANEENIDNFKNITITFKDLPDNLMNGLKNMFLDIEID